MAPHVYRARLPKAWWGRGTSMLAASVVVGALSLSAGASAAALPEIRTSANNAVPACVTPQRLMSFLKSRNSGLDPRFSDIAKLYKRHGERWHVRWDYAFYQMAVETNFLSYKQGNGRWGDVDPKQNNFAGLGTTGGGVPGDRYPDVNTGVLAQIQHLVAYSGERVANPVGERTRLKQDDIVEQMARFNGHVTFNDLSRRWAVDRHYGEAIEWVAGNYRAIYCKPGAQQRADVAPEKPEAAPASASVPKRAAALAPAEALGGPAVAAEPTAETMAEAVAAPTAVAAAAASTTARSSQPTAPEATASGSPVHTIWSRDKETATAAAQATPEPSVKAKSAQQMAPLPVAKAALAPDPVIIAAAAAHPASAAEGPATSPPEGQPVEESKPALVVMAPTAAIDAAPATPRAIEDLRAFAFAPSINLAELQPAQPPKPNADAASGGCRVLAANYGGTKTLLVRTTAGANIHYTALTVLDGFEGSMLDNFLKAHAPGGSSLGEYESKDAALAKARELCPDRASAPKDEGASAG